MNRNALDRSPTRVYTTVAQRQRWIELYQRSGLTQSEFTRRHHLAVSTFCKWLQQFHQAQAGSENSATRHHQAKKVLRLKEVPLAQILGGSAWVAELSQPSGTVLRISATIPLSILERLLAEASC